MKQKGILILVLAAGLAAALAVMQAGKKTKQYAAPVPQGTPVLPQLSQGDTLNRVAEMEIIYPASTITVQRINGLWCAPDQAGHPVRFDSVADFLRRLANLKIGQVITVNEPQKEELGLKRASAEDHHSAYTRILLRDEAGQTLAELVLGRSRTGDPAQAVMGAQGRYVLANDVVSVVTESFYALPRNALSWMDTAVFAFSPAEVSTLIAQEPGADELTFSRDASNQWTCAAFAEEELIDPDKVNRLAELFNNLSFAGVLPRDPEKMKEQGLEEPRVYRAKTRTGEDAELRVGAVDPVTGHRFAVADITFMATTPEPTDDALRRLAETEKARQLLQQWVYLIPAHRFTGVFTHRDDYLLPPEDATAPDTEEPAESPAADAPA